MDYQARESTNGYLNNVSRRIAAMGHYAESVTALARKSELEKLETIEELFARKKELFAHLEEVREFYREILRERDVLIAERGKDLDADREGFIVEMMEFGDKVFRVCIMIDDARERLMDRLFEKMNEMLSNIEGLKLEREKLEKITESLRARIRNT